MMIDSHAHLNFEEFTDDWQAVIADCQRADIAMINIGSQLATSRRAISIAQQYDHGVFAAVGLHPIHVEGSTFHPELFDPLAYAELVHSSDKVVAIGETGIDFFHDNSNFASQQRVFAQHIRLAIETNRAVVIHGRNSRDGTQNAYQAIHDIAKKEKLERAVVHCFGGSLEDAQALLTLGYYIGFTGVITFKNAAAIQAVVKAVPLERLLIETDCPYLAPEPFRGKRNQPRYVQYVAEKVAELKAVSIATVIEQTTRNAQELFGLS